MFSQQALVSPPSTMRTPTRVFSRTISMRAQRVLLDNTKRRGTNLYQVLRLQKGASLVQIKAAYRSLAKQFHPDTNTSGSINSGDFMEIHNAYATLSNPMSKARYDLSTSLSLSIGLRCGDDRFVRRQTQTRRWETDQCW